MNQTKSILSVTKSEKTSSFKRALDSFQTLIKVTFGELPVTQRNCKVLLLYQESDLVSFKNQLDF